MKGDIVILEPHHILAAELIVSKIVPDIKKATRRFIIAIAGESGSGKSEMAAAIAAELSKFNIKPSTIICQGDYSLSELLQFCLNVKVVWIQFQDFLKFINSFLNLAIFLISHSQ